MLFLRVEWAGAIAQEASQAHRLAVITLMGHHLHACSDVPWGAVSPTPLPPRGCTESLGRPAGHPTRSASGVY